ncbi:MAG: hypothetical protein EOP85_07085 [Verrucomicrobiaceae bacterium]|nr:MAG: hypothetical protein EOP85_07085 [Verrucomicrobiaceae bacterium]
MTTHPSDHPPTVEEGVNALLHDAKKKACESYEHCEQCIRDSPAKAIMVAVAAGYLLHRLPVRSLLVSQVRVVAALAPPTLFAFGAAKLCEFLQGQARGRSTARTKASGARSGNVAGGSEYVPPV